MLADFENSFTVGLSSKFTTRLVIYFPSYLKYVATPPCEIQKINNSTMKTKDIEVLGRQVNQQTFFMAHGVVIDEGTTSWGFLFEGVCTRLTRQSELTLFEVIVIHVSQGSVNISVKSSFKVVSARTKQYSHLIGQGGVMRPRPFVCQSVILSVCRYRPGK